MPLEHDRQRIVRLDKTGARHTRQPVMPNGPSTATSIVYLRGSTDAVTLIKSDKRRPFSLIGCALPSVVSICVKVGRT